MALLVAYVLIALVFSFLCSIAEAVILSVDSGYIAVLEGKGRVPGRILRNLKDDINKPLSAILTLNTVAHTVGAAGAGAQAAAVFGNAYLGVASAVLTLLILVFSEIIPKTLGAHYWQQLAPATAYALRGLIWALYPFVKLSEWLTRAMTRGPTLTGFGRQEFSAMADLSVQEGHLAQQESRILKNLMSLHGTRVKDVMTPRTVVFTVDEELTVGQFCSWHKNRRFSRIPVYRGDKEHIIGFALRIDLLLAEVEDKSDNRVGDYVRELPAVPEPMPLPTAFDELLQQRTHILLVVDEYGGMEGVITLEDVLETLLGLEIVDEQDRTTDMRKLARRLWRRRMREMGLEDLERLE